jgi:hypothetical protein
MRGDDEEQASVWSYIPLEQRVPAEHPLRPMVEGDSARAFFDRVVAQARQRGLLSDEHFTIDRRTTMDWPSTSWSGCGDSWPCRHEPAPQPCTASGLRSGARSSARAIFFT